MLDNFKESMGTEFEKQEKFESIFEELRSRKSAVIYCWNKVVIEAMAVKFEGVPGTDVDEEQLLKRLGADQVLKSVQQAIELSFRGIGIIHQGLMPCLNNWTLS